MASKVDTVTIDCADASRLAGFWSAALGYEIEDVDDDGALIEDPTARGVAVYFQIVPESKSVKNRVHLDLRPPESMAEEVERLTSLGASGSRYVRRAVVTGP